MVHRRILGLQGAARAFLPVYKGQGMLSGSGGGEMEMVLAAQKPGDKNCTYVEDLLVHITI